MNYLLFIKIYLPPDTTQANYSKNRKTPFGKGFQTPEAIAERLKTGSAKGNDWVFRQVHARVCSRKPLRRNVFRLFGFFYRGIPGSQSASGERFSRPPCRAGPHLAKASNEKLTNHRKEI